MPERATVRRFLNSVRIVHSVGTHVSQNDHCMMEKEGYDFMDVVNNETAGVNRDDIPNMDQTLLPFSYHLSSTLEQKGAKTVTLAACCFAYWIRQIAYSFSYL